MTPLITIRPLVAFALLAASAVAGAQDFPNRPVKLVTPYASGGATDILARTLAQKLSELWGQQVLVENKPGASGVLGTEFVRTSAPDGYTVQLGTITTHVLNPILLPTVAESGLPGYEAGAWYGFFVPAATPRAVTQKLSADIVRAVDSADVQAKLGELGAEPLTLSSPAFVELIQRDRDVWTKLIRERGIKVGN